ncbi:YdbH domain-containing protein [Skermanella sp. TT6]|uniref:YdbH domain-containing protein n=1 Tax=Skermanella cutis TaxID=2775420 RepID=A0ABX7AZW4_9PROT|nr:YdbH domain-containing protein [Skermanella sp. TT6]QQP87624.1 YdbH domain-containing protein [Skermanella sp. TT6]
MARRWTWIFPALVAVVGAGLLGLPSLVEWQGERMLRDSGWPDARVDVVRMDLSGTDIDVWNDAARERRIGRIELAYSFAAGIGGRLDLDMPLSGLMPDGVEVKDAALRTAGTIRSEDGRWSYVPDGCVTLTASGAAAGPVRVSEPKSLCLEAVPGKGFLDYSLAEGTVLAFAVRPAPLRLTVQGVPVAGRSPAMVVDAALAATGAPTGIDVAWRQGTISLPRQGVVGEGLSGKASFDPAKGRPLTADYAIATIRHDRPKPLVAPLRAKGHAEGDPLATVRFDARLADAGGAVAIAISGEQDMAAGAGSAEVRIPPVRFAPDGPGLTGLFPLLGDWVETASGTFGMDGRFAWGEGSGKGSASILIEDAAVGAGGVTAQGINAVLTADSLAPIRLPPGQILSVALMDVGLPLTNAVVDFGGAADRLSVARAQWQWAGGIVRALPFDLGPGDFKPGGEERTIELEATGIDLQRLLSVAAVEGLSATGTLGGRLPVRIGPDSVTVADGKLETMGPGTLRYDPEAPPSFLKGDPGSSTDMLLQALTDFRYESIELAVNGTAGGEMAIGFAIRGSNPDFYDGYPVALNLNVDGALDTILRRGITTYRIPEAVRDRIQEFQAQDK